jgi:glycosyltransferase involved in cell wall biosynthesis
MRTRCGDGELRNGGRVRGGAAVTARRADPSPGDEPARDGARPVLFVTNHVPPDRAGAFAALHERTPLLLALFGGRSHHATAGLDDPGVPHLRLTQRGVHALAASGRFAAVVAGTAGRVALPAAYLGARRSRTPFVLWSALWSDLTTPAHVAARPLLKHIHRHAAVVVGYGPHVAAYATRLGARATAIAPQAVDNAFWSAPVPHEPHPFTALFVGRDVPEKGLPVLREAWRRAGFDAARLEVVTGVEAHEVRNSYAHADVVVVPSIATRHFLEPWGLVVNEAMNQRVPIIATDAVGAAAGGLVRDGRNGLVVPAGDADALAAALRTLHGDPGLRARLGEQGARDVASYTYAAWADAFADALRGATSGSPNC